MAVRSLVQMIMRRLGTTLLLAVSLTLCSQPVSGTGGGGTNIGAFVTSTADDTGSREWVELVCTGGLLSGWPRHEAIELITVYAPGCDGDHLILRELVSSAGRRSLLFSAPASLAKKTLRATLYVKHHAKDLILLEYQDGDWKPRRPQPIRVAMEDNHDTLQDNLLAFSVAGLGLFSLLESHEPDVSGSSRIPQEPSASSLVGGGMSRGVLPWVWSVLLLLAGWTMSHLIHRIEQRTGE